MTPKGADKGNTKLNMACIRSERKAIDRQYPGEMPKGYDVYDEQFVDVGENVIEGEGVVLDEPEPEGVEEIGDTAELGEERDSLGGGAGETISSTPKGEEPEKNRKVSAKRDPSSLQNLAQLYSACFEDFKLQPNDVLKELGYALQTDISETPQECYIKIASVRV